MNSKFKLLIGILSFILIFVIAYLGYNALSNKFDPREGLISRKSTTKDSDTTKDKDGNKDKQGANNESDNDEEVYPATDFTVYDVDDNKVNLFDFKGKPIVLNFWASWCPPCRKEMPDFNEVYKEYKDEVVFMMVDLVDGVRETKKKGLDHVREQGYEFPVYFDIDQDAAYEYWISSIPTTLFINADGNIVVGYQGAIDKDVLVETINLIK